MLVGHAALFKNKLKLKIEIEIEIDVKYSQTSANQISPVKKNPPRLKLLHFW